MAVDTRKSWQLSERELTPETFFRQRRQLVKSAGLIGLGIASGLISACGPAGDAIRVGAQEQPAAADLYPARRNPQFTLDRPVTGEAYAASYNNFYEFSVFKSRRLQKRRAPDRPIHGRSRSLAWSRSRGFTISMNWCAPWPLEERLYRFRCVEAWAMAVPWTGFPLARADQESSSRCQRPSIVRFVTFLKPDQAPNQSPPMAPGRTPKG